LYGNGHIWEQFICTMQLFDHIYVVFGNFLGRSCI
jgi:hypothetical protein